MLCFLFIRRHSLSSTKLLSPHSSGEGEEDKPESQLAMVNREIVRRGAVILFCDYVVRLLNMGPYCWDKLYIDHDILFSARKHVENYIWIYLLFTIYEEQYLNLKTLMSKSKLDL